MVSVHCIREGCGNLLVVLHSILMFMENMYRIQRYFAIKILVSNSFDLKTGFQAKQLYLKLLYMYNLLMVICFIYIIAPVTTSLTVI